MAKTINTAPIESSSARSFLPLRAFLGPLFLCIATWFLTRGVTLAFILCAAFFAVWLAALPWGFLNFYSPFAYLVLFLAASYHGGRWLFVGIGAACVLASEIWRGWYPPRTKCVELKFPLAGGTYYVAHGGNSKLLNHHFRNVSQKFALDVLKLNAYGGITSSSGGNTEYSSSIYNEPLLSPCTGTVTSVLDGFPDLPIGERDPEHPAGNHVVIRCSVDDVYVGLAHLRNGSICVKCGDEVVAGQQIGRVGNSGNTTLPHLHIHAKRGGNSESMLDGYGVPMRFGGRWLTRNSIVRVPVASVSS